MQRERRLGKGLGQLLSGGGRAKEEATPVSPAPGTPSSPATIAAEASGRRVGKIPVAKIQPNPWQPRVEFTSAELDELMASLKEQGLLQPITVRARTNGFELVAGERRLRAAKELGWTDIEALVVDATDQQMLEWAVIENLQRASLNPVETARSFRRLIDEFSLTQDEAARRLGQSRANLANTLRLLDLPPEVLALVANHSVAPGAARALLGLSDRSQQKMLADRIAREQLSVRQVEEIVRGMKKSVQAAPKQASGDPNRVAAAEDLQRALGTRVAIVGSQQKGSIRIEYHSSRELQDLYKKLVGLGDESED
jgi:ParB family chromosome partitioning protein